MAFLSNLRAKRDETQPPAATAEPAEPAEPAPTSYALTPTQLHFYDTFGFVVIRGLFADAVDRMERGFEEAFKGEAHELQEPLHFDQRRVIVPGVIDRSPDLAWMLHDRRVVELVTSVLGADYEFANSDGSLFYCDTSWHPDNYGAPMTVHHVKLSFYLEPLSGTNGAIRMIPGTNFWRSEFAVAVREGVNDPAAIREVFGVEPQELPSWVLESQPGDCVVWNFRTVHASFNGNQRRRLFSLNFREATGEATPA